jgi:hypothetical protein
MPEVEATIVVLLVEDGVKAVPLNVQVGAEESENG